MSYYLSNLTFLGSGLCGPAATEPVPTSTDMMENEARIDVLPKEKEVSGNNKPSTDSAGEGVVTPDGVPVEYIISVMPDGRYREGNVDGAIFVTKCISINGLRGAKRAAHNRVMKTDLRKQYKKKIDERLSGKKNDGSHYEISFMPDGKILEGYVGGNIYFEEAISKVGFFAAAKAAKKRFYRLFPDFGITRVFRKKLNFANDSVFTKGNELLYFIPNEGEVVPYGIEIARVIGTLFYVGGPCKKHPLNNIKYTKNKHCVLCCSKLNSMN